jgi:putative oxidoreductase
MNLIHKIETWGDRHHPKLVDIIRMILGLFLVVKGYVFLNNEGYLRWLIVEHVIVSQSPGLIKALIDLVTYMHLLGGTLIFLGLRTRIAALLQLPIVIGAVLFVNILSPFFNSELWLSILVLSLLSLFVLIGSGPLSLDRLLLTSSLKTAQIKKNNDKHN